MQILWECLFELPTMLQYHSLNLDPQAAFRKLLPILLNMGTEACECTPAALLCRSSVSVNFLVMFRLGSSQSLSICA